VAVVNDDFDALLRWLDGRLGERVVVGLAGPADGTTNTQLTAMGPLLRDEREVSLIDPAPGRVEKFTVGDVALVLLEGDLVDVEFEDAKPLIGASGGRVTLPEVVLADFGEVTVTISSAPTSYVVRGGAI
jgi:hypothetical protein